MTRINDKSTYFCGPYKGYCGTAEYDHDSDVYHGEVVGTRDVITFEGRAPAELRRAFRESVDDYLAFCEVRGEQPEKPFSGKFVTRMEPELHKKVSMLAELAGKSLNQYICECLAMAADNTQSSLPPTPFVPGGVRKQGLLIGATVRAKRKKRTTKTRNRMPPTSGAAAFSGQSTPRGR